MKIALFFDDENLKTLNANIMSAIVVDIKDDVIVGVENDFLYSKNLDYISLWLLKKQVNIIYTKEPDDDTRDYFKKIDVEIKTLEDLKESPILNLFLL